MKISRETLNVFKNYASINTNLLLNPGNKLATISSQKNIMSDVTVTETFPVEFGIYDLNEFLGVMTLFNDPELDFSEKHVIISEVGSKIKYFAAESSVLTVPPAKPIQFPDPEINFTLTTHMLAMIQKTASVLHCADMSVTGDGSEMSILVGDKKNVTGNTYSTIVGSTDSIFKINFKAENLKMLAGDYEVDISSKKISRFQSTSSDLKYYIAVEADSEF